MSSGVALSLKVPWATCRRPALQASPLLALVPHLRPLLSGPLSLRDICSFLLASRILAQQFLGYRILEHLIGDLTRLGIFFFFQSAR